MKKAGLQGILVNQEPLIHIQQTLLNIKNGKTDMILVRMMLNGAIRPQWLSQDV